MRYDFLKYSGTKQISMVFKYLREKKINLPHLSRGENVLVYHSENGDETVTLVCPRRNQCYFVVFQAGNGYITTDTFIN